MRYLFIIFIVIFMTGCWNYRETDEFNIIAGSAIDYSPNEIKTNYMLTTELVNISSGEFSSEVMTTYGDTVFDTTRDFIFNSGKKIYWGTNEAIIISNEIAKDNIIPVLDFTFRDAEIRDDLHVFISQEDTAKEIFESYYPKFITSHSYSLVDMLKNQEVHFKYSDNMLWKIVKDLYAEDISATIPFLKLSKSNGESLIELGDLGIINKGKLIGSINETESMIFFLIRNKFHKGFFNVSSIHENTPYIIDYKVTDLTTKLIPTFLNNEIQMTIKSNLSVIIVNLTKQLDYKNKKTIEILEDKASTYLSNQIKNLVSKLQNDYETDILGFGQIIKNKNPKLWKELRTSWEKEFKDIKISTNINVEIIGSGLINETINITH